MQGKMKEKKRKLEREHSNIIFRKSKEKGERTLGHLEHKEDKKHTSKRQTRKVRSTRGIHVVAKNKVWTTTSKGKK